MTHSTTTPELPLPQDACYVTSDGYTYDAFHARELPGSFLSLGKATDTYHFRRFSKPGLATELAEKRIKNLRDQYGYLRLWYSGGKDSQLILDTAIRTGVKIDEIVVIRFGYRNHRNLWPTWSPAWEIENTALPYLEKIKSSIPDTKITLLEYDEEVYEHVFSHSDWHRYTLNWFYCCMPAHGIFYNLIQPKFKFLDEVENKCDLKGGTTPEIWWDQEKQQWQCCYVDAQLLNSMGRTNEDFLLGTTDCELLEAHINSIIDTYEQLDYRPARFEKNQISNFQVDGHRSIRDCSEIYKFDLINPNVTPKSIPKGMVMPFEHFLWSQNIAKGFWCIVNMMAQPTWPKCLDLYVNHTNWQEIESLCQKGGMLSRVWTMED
jgi:hypothetical protein